MTSFTNEKLYYNDESVDVIELCCDDIDEDGTVINDTFKNKIGLIKIYAHWCGHCKDLIDTMKFLATELKPHEFKVGAINLALDKNKKNKFLNNNVIGFPTLFFVNPIDGKLLEYNDSREKYSILDNISTYVEKIIQELD